MLPLLLLAPTVTLDGLLDEMVRYDAVARWPEIPYTAKQASSYDRHRVAPDQPGWFANDDAGHYIRTEEHHGRQERVMMEASGPGAIVRLFSTNGGGDDNRIRVYIDGADEPAILWPKSDFLSGDLKIGEPLVVRHPKPEGHGGGTWYFPIPYSKSCKVTLEDKNPPGQSSRLYYHVGYRAYAPGTVVEPFSLAMLAKARPKIAEVNRLLSHPPTPSSDRQTEVSRTLKLGDEVSLDLPAGENAVRQLELSIGDDLSPAVREQALRSVNISATFDDEKNAIWCPVGDFAGSGAGGHALNGWYRTVDGKGHSVSRWTMPYRRHARFTLKNLGDFPVRVKMVARTERRKWDDRSLYFRCNWHAKREIPSRPDQDWNFLDVQGRGVLVGDVMSVFNPIPSWYGEGDEKIWVDGESFPGILGTGTEDYYNASFAPNPVYQTPFSSQPRIDEPRSQGYNAYTRTRNLDAVPFTKSLKFDFEITTWQESRVDYATTTYWYAAPGATPNPLHDVEETRQPMKTLPAPFVIQGAVELENVPIIRKSEGLVTSTQDMHPFPGRWSSDAHLLVKGRRQGDFVEVASPCSGKAPRRLSLCATKANDYATLSFTVNGQIVRERFNGYAPTVSASGPIPLGIFTPVNGRFVLRVEVVGADQRCEGERYLVGLDAVVISN